MTQIDPSRFIIKRKRKKFRFALFANSPICFEVDEWQRRRIDWLELGAGSARFSVELAASYPGMTFLAVDVKGDRLQKGARIAEARNLRNVFFVRARAEQLPSLMPDGSLHGLWLTFPDPFGKKRSSNRRLTNPRFLRIYANLLAPGMPLYLKTDNRALFEWSLMQLVAEGWYIKELSFDLHDDLSETADARIITDYESRYLAEGAKIYFVVASAPAVE